MVPVDQLRMGLLLHARSSCAGWGSSAWRGGSEAETPVVVMWFIKTNRPNNTDLTQDLFVITSLTSKGNTVFPAEALPMEKSSPKEFHALADERLRIGTYIMKHPPLPGKFLPGIVRLQTHVAVKTDLVQGIEYVGPGTRPLPGTPRLFSQA